MPTLKEMLDKKQGKTLAGMLAERQAEAEEPKTIFPTPVSQEDLFHDILLDIQSVKDVESHAKRILGVADKLKIPADKAEEVLLTVDRFSAVRDDWKQKGKKGFWEKAAEDAMTKIPFSPAGAVNNLDLILTSGRIQRDDYEEPPSFGAYYPPRRERLFPITEVRFRREWIPELQKQRDIGRLEKHFERLAEEEARGVTFLGKVGAGVSVLPAWMIEFAATGGLKKMTSKAATKFLDKRIKSHFTKKALAFGAGTAARVAFMPHRIGEAVLDRQLSEDPENWATSIILGWSKVFIEAASEETGETLTKGLASALSQLPFGSKLINNLQRAWMSISPKNTSTVFARRIFTKAGYSNIIGEIGEERLATVLHSVIGTEDFGAGEDAGVLERLQAGLQQDIDNFPAEVAVLAVPGFGRFVLGKVTPVKETGKAPKEQREIMERVLGEVETLAEDRGPASRKRIEEAVKKGRAELKAAEEADVTAFAEEAAAGLEPTVAEVTPKKPAVLPPEVEITPPEPIAKPEKVAKPLPTKEVTPEIKDAEVIIPAVEGKKAIALSDKEVHELMRESLNKNEYTMYLQDEVQARTQGDQEAATRAFDQEANVLFERGYLYDKNNKEWVRVSAGEKTRIEKLAKEKIAPTPKPKPPEPPRDILGGVDPIQQIKLALSEAKAVRPITEAEKAAARRKRVGAAAGAMKSNLAKGTPADEAIFKSTGLLKGPLTEYDQLYTSIEDVLEPGAKDAAYRKIYQHPGLQYFEILNTATAFKKLLAGTSLTPTDVSNIENVFGKAFKAETDIRTKKSSLYDRAITLWKAGLLTGIKTSGLNTLANMSHAISETAKDIPAVGIDSVASLFTGERTLAFTVQGAKGGIKEGFGRGWKYLRTGYDERNIGEKLDFKRVHFGNSKIAKGLQTYEETIFHLLGAEDQPFYYGAKARSLYSQAIAQAKNKKLKGKERDVYVKNKVANPTDEMLIASVHDAEVAVFQNRTTFGDIAKAVQKVKGGEIVVPFGRTPSAVAMQIINYSPVGAVKAVAEAIHKGEFNQRKFSQAIGRSTVGTAALYIGTLLFREGLMTLDHPDNERERKLWELEGRKPNSIKIGNKWRSIQVLGPVGNVLIIGGHFEKQLKKEGSPTKAIVTALTGGAKSFSEQTFVRGVNQAVDALSDPERSFDNWFTSMMGSAVPTIVADIARAMDEQERRTVGPGERIISRTPVVRRGLEPRVDVFGNDLPRYGGNILETMIDPSRPSKIRQDVVVDELRRLFDKDIKVSPTQLGDRKGYEALTAKENTQLWRRSGELVYKAIMGEMNTVEYAKLPDEIKGNKINKAVKTAKDIARIEMAIIKLNHGTSAMKLLEGGLLTSALIIKMGEIR